MPGGKNDSAFSFEDFPALPGSSSNDKRVRDDEASCSEALLSSYQEPTSANQSLQSTFEDTISDNQAPKAMPTQSDTNLPGDEIAVPDGMLKDQYGLMAIASYLRLPRESPTTMLALGMNLASLGMELTSPAPQKNTLLLRRFGGPFANFPARPFEIDVETPPAYRFSTNLLHRLAGPQLNKQHEDVLFYLFYNMTGEAYQLAAAAELYAQNWRYHKVECIWLTRNKFANFLDQTGSSERGTYTVFDPVHWAKVQRPMHLVYSELAERPVVDPQMLKEHGCSEQLIIDAQSVVLANHLQQQQLDPKLP